MIAPTMLAPLKVVTNNDLLAVDHITLIDVGCVSQWVEIRSLE